MAAEPQAGASREEAIEGYPGPYEVGVYAHRLRDRLRSLARVCLIGEVTNLRIGRGVNVYFELRDADGAMPCAMWKNEFERLGLAEGDLRDGAQVVAAGGCDYYPGGASASPSFAFRVSELRLAGEGDLLARLERLRKALAHEGLLEPQKLLPLAGLPRTIGVVTAAGSAARKDFLAGVERRGWRGTIVWAYAPVQDRRAAPAIAAALRDLAALGGAGGPVVDTIVVTRGGGSIADLWAFCDETLCRTVALLPVPVISAVGHETDRTLLDDVAAVCCSTPTHAAEAAVGVDCRSARARLATGASRLDSAGRQAVVTRARWLGARSRAPREHVARHRSHLHQKARELRAASGRIVTARVTYQQRVAVKVLSRKLMAARASAAAGRSEMGAAAGALERSRQARARREAEALRRMSAALRAHDPDRTLERGYALAVNGAGEPLGDAAAARAAGSFDLRMAGGTVPARVREREEA